LEYIPFGEVFIDERPSASSWSTPYKFNAKELDEETGLYYYGARYYDPRTSVWISVDPLAEKYSGWSSYVYVHDNPLRFTDPDGKGAKDRVLAARNMTGIPYLQEHGSLRTGNYNAALVYMDCSELASRVMVADHIINSGTGLTSSSMKVLLDNQDKYVHSETAQIGDIALWKGHVAIVTGVRKNGKIDVIMARGGDRPSKEFQSATPDKLSGGKFYGYYHPINETPDGKVQSNGAQQPVEDNKTYFGKLLDPVTVIGQKTETDVNIPYVQVEQRPITIKPLK